MKGELVVIDLAVCVLQMLTGRRQYALAIHDDRTLCAHAACVHLRIIAL
jgi:hypothetical protein